MGRAKKCRDYSFKPNFTSFSPCCGRPKLGIELNHDELEAIFLMDYQDMYQEDAAKLMNISRPTLSRIIKSARNKIATAIINGAKLNIADDKTNFVIAICVDKEEEFEQTNPQQPLILIMNFEKDTLLSQRYIPNPIILTQERPSKILPITLKEENVNFFLTEKIGEGLKNSLATRGIFVKEVKNIKNIEDIQRLFK